MAITIRPVKKQYFDGTHRYRSPGETHAAIEPLMAEIGVSEITDLTPLDRIGIPVFSAVRPGAARGLSASTQAREKSRSMPGSRR